MKVATLLDPTGSGFGFLLPIFVDSGISNQAFVQRISLTGAVIEFEPFDPANEMYDIPAEQMSRAVGDDAIWAFKCPNSEVYCGTAPELSMLLTPVLRGRLLSKYPVVECELARFCRDEQHLIALTQRIFTDLSALSRISAEIWRDENVMLPELRRMLAAILSPRACTLLPEVRLVSEDRRATILLPPTIWDEFQRSRQRGPWNEPYLSRLGHAVSLLQVSYERRDRFSATDAAHRAYPTVALVTQRLEGSASSQASAGNGAPVRMDDGSFAIPIPPPWMASTFEAHQEAWSAPSLEVDMHEVISVDVITLMTLISKVEERSLGGLTTTVTLPGLSVYYSALHESGFVKSLQEGGDGRGAVEVVDVQKRSYPTIGEGVWGIGSLEYYSFASWRKSSAGFPSIQGMIDRDWNIVIAQPANDVLRTHLLEDDVRILRTIHESALLEALRRSKSRVVRGAQCLAHTKNDGALFFSLSFWDDGAGISDVVAEVARWQQSQSGMRFVSVGLRSGTELVRSERMKRYSEEPPALKLEKRNPFVGNLITFRFPRA